MAPDLNSIAFEGPVCPLPLLHEDTIVMGHGSGGQMTQELIENIFKPRLTSPGLEAGNDFAKVTLPIQSGLKGTIITSVDSHIVSPLFFPGGDIGRLAVCGTVNDIAMSGATPLYLTAGFILEEGLPVETLDKVLQSMQAAAQEAGVQFVAGDTKVTEKGKGDGLFVCTTGIGWLPEGICIGGEQAKPGDIVLISGNLGDHGIAVLTARGELGFTSEIKSDVAPLNDLIRTVLKAAPDVHVLRDPTRGGLATALDEIACQSKVTISIEEKSIPVNPMVKAACEMLGFDPLYIANEGKVIVIVPPQQADAALNALRNHPYGKNAVRIGEVTQAPHSRVILRTLIGGTRLLDKLAGEMLPRIC
jgi:hydrogenase expression/formation protein HypE